jgi:hypothetical protein
MNVNKMILCVGLALFSQVMIGSDNQLFSKELLFRGTRIITKNSMEKPVQAPVDCRMRFEQADSSTEHLYLPVTTTVTYHKDENRISVSVIQDKDKISKEFKVYGYAATYQTIQAFKALKKHQKVMSQRGNSTIVADLSLTNMDNEKELIKSTICLRETLPKNSLSIKELNKEINHFKKLANEKEDQITSIQAYLSNFLPGKLSQDDIQSMNGTMEKIFGLKTDDTSAKVQDSNNHKDNAPLKQPSIQNETPNQKLSNSFFFSFNSLLKVGAGGAFGFLLCYVLSKGQII